MSSILVLAGSPRRNGNTDSLVKAFSEGAESSGNTVDIVRVADYKVSPCTGCNVCETSGDHRCFISDDMDKIYNAMMCHDTLIIASPLYFYSLSAHLKAVIDRLHTPLRNEFSIRRIGMLIVGAATFTDMFDSVKIQYELICRYFDLTDIGTVYVKGVKECDDLLLSLGIKKAFEWGKSIK